jgi:hypothetical protein
MPKLTKTKTSTDSGLVENNNSGKFLMTIASHLKDSLRSNILMKILILIVFLIFTIRRYYNRVPDTEMIDGMEVPSGGEIYDLTID